MAKLSKKILKKIQEDKLKQKPKWEFVLQKAVIWLALICAVLVLSFSISMIIFQASELDLEFLPHMVRRPPIFLRVLPYFWLLIGAALLAFVYYDFRKTKKGYRYNGAFIVGGALILALILGTTIFSLEAPRRLEPVLRERLPFYENVRPNRMRVWNNAERGLLGGTVSSELTENTFELRDLEGQQWQVTLIEDLPNLERIIVIDRMVRLVGQKLSPGNFEAIEIRPWLREKRPKPDLLE